MNPVSLLASQTCRWSTTGVPAQQPSDNRLKLIFGGCGRCGRSVVIMQPATGRAPFLSSVLYYHSINTLYCKVPGFDLPVVPEFEKMREEMNQIEINQLENRITVNPDVLSGKPTIRGLRITVEQILKALSAGVSPQDLLEDYPELEPEDLQAVFAFAAELVRETRLLPIAV
jgi:uncharacterized protein (DUF433 family)